MEYTRGKWEARKLLPDKHGIITKEAWEIFTPEYDVVTQIIGSAPIRNEADAHLIAASPDMYEAIRLYHKHQVGKRGHFCAECWAKLEDALAKAEGQ